MRLIRPAAERESSMKAFKLLLATLVIAAGIAILVGPGLAESQVADNYQRIVRVFRLGPSDACGGDTCSGRVIEPITATFSSVGDVRVVASVSLRYRTSGDDKAEVSLLWRPAGSSTFQDASPGPSPLMTSTERTTTSLSWSIGGLVSGNEYEFTVGVEGVPVETKSEFRVTTKDVVIVLEAT
jgi:hypothetical protein